MAAVCPGLKRINAARRPLVNRQVHRIRAIGNSDRHRITRQCHAERFSIRRSQTRKITGRARGNSRFRQRQNGLRTDARGTAADDAIRFGKNFDFRLTLYRIVGTQAERQCGKPVFLTGLHIGKFQFRLDMQKFLPDIAVDTVPAEHQEQIAVAERRVR